MPDRAVSYSEIVRRDGGRGTAITALDKGGSVVNVIAYGVVAGASAATNRPFLEDARDDAIALGFDRLFFPPGHYDIPANFDWRGLSPFGTGVTLNPSNRSVLKPVLAGPKVADTSAGDVAALVEYINTVLLPALRETEVIREEPTLLRATAYALARNYDPDVDGTTWADESGNGHDLTISGSPVYYQEDGHNSYFWLDGIAGAYFEAADHADLDIGASQDFTLVLFGALRGTTALGRRSIIAKYQGTGNTGYRLTQLTGERTVDMMLIRSGTETIAEGGDFVDLQSVVIAGRRQGTSLRALLNGVAGTAVTDPNSDVSNARTLRIGLNDSSASTSRLVGKIHGWAFFREALTDEEIAELYEEVFRSYPAYPGAAPAFVKSASNPIVVAADLAATYPSAGTVTPDEFLFWHVIRAAAIFDTPLDDYYAYYSTDHDEFGGGIFLAHGPSPLGPWTEYGVVHEDAVVGDQTETPCPVWNPVTELLHLYYQQRNAPTGGQQSSLLATSPDGITFTRVGYALQGSSTLTHRGYMRAFIDTDDGIWWATSLQRGGENPRLDLSASEDGIAWARVAEIMSGEDLLGPEHRIAMAGSGRFDWRGREWVISTDRFQTGLPGSNEYTAEVIAYLFNNDRRSVAYQPVRGLLPMEEAWESENINIHSVYVEAGIAYLYYACDGSRLGVATLDLNA